MKTKINLSCLFFLLLFCISSVSFAQLPGGGGGLGGLGGGLGGLGGGLGGLGGGLGGATTDTTLVVDSILIPLACARDQIIILYHSTVPLNSSNTVSAQLIPSLINIFLGVTGGSTTGIINTLTQQPIEILPADPSSSGGGITSLIGSLASGGGFGGIDYPTTGGVGDTLQFVGTIPANTPTGIYNVKMTSTNPAGASTVSSATVLISSPQVSTSVSCQNDSIFLTATTSGTSPILSGLFNLIIGGLGGGAGGIGELLGGSAEPFTWSNGDTNLTIYADKPGIYTATHTDTTFGCNAKSSKTVVNNPILVDCQMENVQLSSSVEAEKYKWTVDATTYSTSKSITYKNDIVQSFHLFTENPYSCLTFESDASVCADSNEISIYVPTLFTPNGDGINDELYVRGNNIKELYFAVYNRWGETIFETDSPAKGWDGKFKGAEVDPTVLVWYLKIVSHDGMTKEDKGHITLMR